MKKTVQCFQASCGIVKCSHFPRFTGLRPECLAHNRGGDDGDDGGEVLYMCVWNKGYDISEQDDPLLTPPGYLDNITLCNFITFKASNWRFSIYLL